MIRDFLISHEKIKPVSFHMPGHKGAGLYRRFGYDEFLDHIFDCDITEIPGADNLFQNEGIIRETMEKYQKLYDVEKSYLLVNGTSCGIISAVLSAVPEGGELIMARNCHKSVFNAVRLGKLQPVFAYPELLKEGIIGAVPPEEIGRTIEAHPDAKAVILPSPSYYGICSDISQIADICHEHGMILIVDQAHGAHLKFFEDMKAAEECGADIVINSVHKTLASLTQSAVMNVNSDRVSKNTLEDYLQILESTSPSYLLMASLDTSADLLLEHGDNLIAEWSENLDWVYAKLEEMKGVRVLKPSGLDCTKINIDCGFSAAKLEEHLMEHGIFPELNTGNILMLMTGIGNVRSDYERLIRALEMILEKGEPVKDEKRSGEGTLWNKRRKMYRMPQELKKVKLTDAAGMIMAASLIPYPPGIPFLCPGEMMDEEDREFLLRLRKNGEKVIGIEEGELILAGETSEFENIF